MERELAIGLWKTNVLIKEDDEYEKSEIDHDLLGLPDLRKVVKRGEYKEAPATVDLNDVEYATGGRLTSGHDGVRVVFKSGNTLTVLASIDDFDNAWTHFKAYKGRETWLVSEMDRVRTAAREEKDQ